MALQARLSTALSAGFDLGGKSAVQLTVRRY